MRAADRGRTLSSMLRSRWIPALLLISGCDDVVRDPEVPGASMLICPEPVTGREVLFPSMGQPTLVGDYLYVPVLRDGKGDVRVLRLGAGTVQDVGLADGIDGHPLEQGWQHVDGATYARFHEGELEVIDSSEPLLPEREVWPMGKHVQAADRTLGQLGAKLFACVEASGGGELTFVDLADSAAEPTAMSSEACRDEWLFGTLASPGLWAELTWIGPTHESQALTIYSLETGSVLISHAIPDEIGLSRIVLGDTFAAAWSYDETTLDLIQSSGDLVTLESPGFFEFIVDGVGYGIDNDYTNPVTIRAVDLGDSENIETAVTTLEPNRLFSDGGYLLAFAHDERRIVLLTEVGDVWLMPFGTTGSIEPLVWVNEAGNVICPPQ